ncbi:hypothetical protein RQP46_005081 [Phenoliferia psychrophenolica]
MSLVINSAASSINAEEAPPLPSLPLDDDNNSNSLSTLSPSKKSALLAIFCIATFLDVCNVSGVSIAVARISEDIGLGPSQSVWVVTAYSLVFCSFLLFSGRLADIFPAHLIFKGGFLALGVMNLVISFVTSNKYGFLVLRGVCAVCGALVIPSSFHLVVKMYPNLAEQRGKLALLGVSGAVGNVLGLVLAGVLMLANYRWFFRFIAIGCITGSILSIWLIPSSQGDHHDTERAAIPRWKQLDLVGVLLMAGTLLCLILALTQGPIYGWGSASFVAPIVVGGVLAPLFFVWEAIIPATSAMLPGAVWKTTNMVVSSLAILFPYAFWSTSQLKYATFWAESYGWRPIHVAAAILPQGIISLIVGALAQKIPGIIGRPRITIPIGAGLIMIAEVLQVYSDGGSGMNYWKFCFPAFILGSAGAIMSIFASSINLIQSCPPEKAGVTGAWVQVLSQVGGSVCIAVQAGLQGSDYKVWSSSAANGYWFVFAYTGVLALQYVIFYKTPASTEEEHERARLRMKDPGSPASDEKC